MAQALRNAIHSDRVAHAYLFTGARGVGKTSAARILAKALNCPHVNDGVPCNQCEICQGISAGNDVDVMEIDGASNRGIDDIRSLRANVGVRSMRTRYKVYIIDEVHMLTREAFNALLKTLEEPPPNVKFVFCTTEPNKVPDTILSRCQRFDFSAIGDASISHRLAEIALAEGFEVAADALELVARRARGSMRDGQSLLDQLLAFSQGTVHADDVHRMLGTASDERLVTLFTAIAEHRPGEVLSLIETYVAAGVQSGELVDQSLAYVRDLMVVLCSGGNAIPLASVSSRFAEQMAEQAARLSMHSVMAAFQILAEAKNQMFRTTFGRTILEMALVQLTLLENLSAISELLSGKLPALPDLPRTDNPGARAALPPAAPTVAVAVAPQAQRQPEPEPVLSTRMPAAVRVSEPVPDPAGASAEPRLASGDREPGATDKAATVVPAVVSAAPTNPSAEVVTSEIAAAAESAAGTADSADREPSQKSQELGGTGKAQPPQKKNAETVKSDRSPKNHERDVSVNLIHEVDPACDAFVRHVVGVFGATVVKIMPAPALNPSENAESTN